VKKSLWWVLVLVVLVAGVVGTRAWNFHRAETDCRLRVRLSPTGRWLVRHGYSEVERGLESYAVWDEGVLVTGPDAGLSGLCWLGGGTMSTPAAWRRYLVEKPPNTPAWAFNVVDEEVVDDTVRLMTTFVVMSRGVHPGTLYDLGGYKLDRDFLLFQLRRDWVFRRFPKKLAGEVQRELLTRYDFE